MSLFSFNRQTPGLSKTMSSYHKMLVLRFSNTLKNHELPLFRGAVIASISRGNNLYHNHNDDLFRYSYPLIQYKIIENEAAILCIDDGVNSIEHILENPEFALRIGQRTISMSIKSIKRFDFSLTFSDEKMSYSITKWLPLNQDRYSTYLHLPTVTDKIEFLEKILVGNLLSLAKGLGIILSQQIELEIIQVDEEQICNFKKMKMYAISLVFTTNLILPDFIGLGKGVSMGYGVINKLNHNNLKDINQ